MTTVAILAGVYFFVVAPILDTAEDEIERSAERQQEAFREGQERSRQFDLGFARSQATSYAQSLRAGSQPWHEAADEVLACVREAGDDGRRMQRCSDFGEIVVTETLSDRNFAVSYADSLDLQGDTAAGDRVRDCVRDAGFKPVPMQRCYDLADKLLFG